MLWNIIYFLISFNSKRWLKTESLDELNYLDRVRLYRRRLYKQTLYSDIVCLDTITSRVVYTIDYIMSLSFIQRHIQHLRHFLLWLAMCSDNNILDESFGCVVFYKEKSVRFGLYLLGRINLTFNFRFFDLFRPKKKDSISLSFLFLISFFLSTTTISLFRSILFL